MAGPAEGRSQRRDLLVSLTQDGFEIALIARTLDRLCADVAGLILALHRQPVLRVDCGFAVWTAYDGQAVDQVLDFGLFRDGDFFALGFKNLLLDSCLLRFQRRYFLSELVLFRQ